ncbi:MCE-family protein [Mycolicibacterium conceptionense]|uniref:MCE-family protein n=1 Tax=Mycolicibacterium conceptionense TaxID=451644 RepID=A0A0U1DHA9_9MYCO|nr:MCE-family protein [Mycolicibacterium conceptionense]
MLKYRESNLVRVGLIGIVLAMLVVAVGLQPERITSWATALRYQAQFREAGGLTEGNDVVMSGMKVGTVSDISLRSGKALVTFTVAGRYRLGQTSTAHIQTGSLLGERELVVIPDGADRLRPTSVIPVSRTSSPYSLTDAVGDLTTNTAGLDTGSLNEALNTLAATLDDVTPQLAPRSTA